MKIYTRKGDDGTTSLSGGRRVYKHELRIEAYGTVDELICWVGLLRGAKECDSQIETLMSVQSELMMCAAALAHDRTNPASKAVLPHDDCAGLLEAEIDTMENALPKLESFILPGGSPVVSHCHITRCVCRRAERAVLRLKAQEVVPEIVVKYLNRLSDYLFVLGRFVSLRSGNEEIKWTL